MAYPEYPETKDEWWQFVEENWTELLSILHKFLPVYNRERISREGKVEEINHTMVEEIKVLKNNKDSHLARYFSAAWMAAPDRPGIRNIPGWFVMCDLCSEEYVLYNK